jgi:hypothetical protein
MTLTAEYDRLFIDKQSPDAYRSMSAVASAVAHTAEAAGLDRASGAPARLLTVGRTRPHRRETARRSGQGRGRTVRTRMTWSRNSAM